MARHTRDIILTVYTYSLQGPEPVLREQAGLLRNGYDVVAHGGVGDEHDGRGDEQRADGARSVGRAGPGRARRGAGNPNLNLATDKKKSSQSFRF